MREDGLGLKEGGSKWSGLGRDGFEWVLVVWVRKRMSRLVVFEIGKEVMQW